MKTKRSKPSPADFPSFFPFPGSWFKGTGIAFATLLIIAITITADCEAKNKAGSFKVGVGVVDITPPVGYPQYSGISTGVKDPLHAKALVFKQGDNHGALLVCEIISVTRDLSLIVREQASRKTGIPLQNISISATHTHTGPRFSVQEYADREAAGKLTQEDRESYVGQLVGKMIESIVIANNRLQEAEITGGVGYAPGISFNRRYLMTDGRVRFNPGNLNPKNVRPVAPVDPDVHFALFKPLNNDSFNASLTVFASHYARGGTDFSADYAHYLQMNLNEIFGEQIVSIYGFGTGGDINTNNPDAPSIDAQTRVERIGKVLAEAIKEALPSARKSNPDFKVVSRTIHLPMQDYTEAEYKWALDKNAPPLYNERSFLQTRRRMKILSLAELREREAIPPSISGDPYRLPVEIHVFRLDDQNAIVTTPGHNFVELGLELKERSPFVNTMIIDLANARVGYTFHSRVFGEGDYEAINSRLLPGAAEKMIDEAVQILNDLYPR